MELNKCKQCRWEKDLKCINDICEHYNKNIEDLQIDFCDNYFALNEDEYYNSNYDDEYSEKMEF